MKIKASFSWHNGLWDSQTLFPSHNWQTWNFSHLWSSSSVRHRLGKCENDSSKLKFCQFDSSVQMWQKWTEKEMITGSPPFFLPLPLFPRLGTHIFTCLSLTHHPYYLRAWNMLGYILAAQLSQNDLNEPAANNYCFQRNICCPLNT